MTATRWKCGKTGHAWSPCPLRKPSDRAVDLPHRHAWAQPRVQRMRTDNRKPNTPNTNANPAAVSRVDVAEQKAAAPVANQPRKAHAVADTAVIYVHCVHDQNDDQCAVIDDISDAEVDASMTDAIGPTPGYSATGVAEEPRVRAQRLFVNVEVENIFVKALLDTGSLLRCSTWRTIRQDRASSRDAFDLPSRFAQRMIRVFIPAAMQHST